MKQLLKKLGPILLLSGCMVGPRYEAPEVSIDEKWSSDETVDTNAPVDRWWEVFEDELLSKYIEKAGCYNYNIQVAEANILRARAFRTVTASALFPHVNFDLNGTKTYFSKQGPVFAIGPAAGDPFDTGSAQTGLPFTVQVPQIQNLFNALFDVSWELDLFGKTRHAVEAAVAEVESLIDLKNDLLISTYAELARNYVELRSFQKRAKLLQRNIALLEKQEAILEESVRRGYRNQYDLESLRSDLSAAKAAYPDTQSEIYRAIYTISTLIGEPPETLVDELIVEKEPLTPPDQIAVGLRSDLLLRRPDLRYAERKLAEATAAIGVAVASFFPTISAIGTGGFQSLLLPKLFEWGSRTWAYGADVNMPLFEGGELVGSLRFTQAVQAAAGAYYQQAVLNALQETESTLKKYEDLKATTAQYTESVEHKDKVLTITRERHLKGLINEIALLHNEQQFIATELTLLDSQTAQMLSLLSLYKSLGGGWQLEEK